MKFEQLKKTVECYALLNGKERKEIDSKIDDAWWSMSKEFAKMCKDDAECESLRKQLWDIHAIQSFVLVKVTGEPIADCFEAIFGFRFRIFGRNRKRKNQNQANVLKAIAENTRNILSIFP